MIWYPLQIGRWTAEFYFAPDGYDAGEVLDRMYEFGAPADILRRADELMTSGDLNTGFTFSNPAERLAVVAIGPTSGGEEFQDTLVHEIHHLAAAIAASLGIDLESETPAYIAGDSARAMASIICTLGCTHCRREK